MKRREFLHAGIAIPALPVFAGVSFDALAAALPGAPAVRLHKLVYDERFPESRAFGVEARRLRIPAYAIRGDVTNLWYRDLDLRWRDAPAAIAGMTTGDALFCLERFAWDRGLRVAFRAEHSCLPGGATEHRVYGSPAHVSAAVESLDGEADWGPVLARLVTNCPRGRHEISGVIVNAPPMRTGVERMPLVSWVIAPARNSRRDA